jgi:chorismate mutase
MQLLERRHKIVMFVSVAHAAAMQEQRRTQARHAWVVMRHHHVHHSALLDAL